METISKIVFGHSSVKQPYILNAIRSELKGENFSSKRIKTVHQPLLKSRFKKFLGPQPLRVTLVGNWV